MSKLNPLLRLAAIAGVETAVKLHIRRGDDLDARDSSGATPLILAAARRRKGVVRLLLDAGVNPTVVDEHGMDALAHAKKSGCRDTIAYLTEGLMSLASRESDFSRDVAWEVPEPALEGQGVCCEAAEEAAERRAFRMEPRSGIAIDDTADVLLEATAPRPEGVVDASPSEVTSEGNSVILSLDDEPLEALFAGDWETEEELFPPEGDETVVQAVRQVHETIERHSIVDSDEDWGDVDVHLPKRAVPLSRDEATSLVRNLFLVALREGMVAEDDLIELCSNADGTRNEDAERALAVVVGELGATVVEWTGGGESFRVEPSMNEELLLTEAVEFAEELTSGYDEPFRFYSRDLRGDLLDADEEIALGREMEEAGHAALSALALWPEGLSAVFEAADRVAKGEAEAEAFCAGPEPSVNGEQASRTDSLNDESEGEPEPELDEDVSFFVAAVSEVRAACGDARRVIKALEEARLTRGFLLELADSTEPNDSGGAFVLALERQMAARDRMILRNLRLALSNARKYMRSGMPIDDLVQEANIGLMKAVERFDWRRGFRFSTYATWWIRQQLSRSIADKSRIVRAPVHVHDRARKLLRERDEMEARLGRPVGEVEIAGRIGASVAKTRILLSVFYEPVSLDEVNPETGLSGVDELPATQAFDPVAALEHASLRSTLLEMLNECDERTQEIIQMRFGLGGEDAMTLEEVGQHFNVTRERIRQIEAKALNRLRHPVRSERLRGFLE